MSHAHHDPTPTRRPWLRRMQPRDPHEAHRASTPLELLFDLCFVVAIAQVGARLHHAIAEDHVVAAIPLFWMVFFAIWWAWMNFTWFASAYDTDDVPYRLAVFVIMIGALIVAAPMLRLAIKVTGIGYLLWLAYKLSRSARLAEANAAQLNVGFWQGAALQFVNIKAWMLALTIVAGWVAGRDDVLTRLAIVVPVMLAFALASNFAYAAMGALLRNWLAQGNRLLWFNRCMALVLVATAAWMVNS